MKINYKEQNVIEIIKKNNSKKVNIKDIESIYIGYKLFLFIRLYYLKIITNDKEIVKFKFNKKHKEQIKKDIYQIRIIKNWGDSN
ncbi:MAG: hypothetical protein NWQ14_02010 [Flavobacterium sp.]|nr:hypothetical protein [Flavobacterium sp.]MDP5026971.1 hypothetical protein [Flavobacterium sp.]MDP5097105.1 hypothetical protein [Flavobacterium sp.]